MGCYMVRFSTFFVKNPGISGTVARSRHGVARIGMSIALSLAVTTHDMEYGE
jgi:hypothetical protein